MTTNELIEALDEKAKPLQKFVDRRVSGAIVKAKESPAEPTLEDREKLLERKETVLSSAIERGLDPKAAMALLGIGSDDATDDERLDLIVEYTQTTEQATKDAILKEHTRNPRLGSLDMTPMSLEQIAELPDHVQAKLPPSVTEPALQAHIDKRKSLPTPRADIRTRLFGGQK